MSVTQNPGAPDQITAALAKAENFLARYKMLTTLSEKAGVARVYVAAGLALLISLIVHFLFGADTLVNLVGFIYPARHTVQTMRSGVEDLKFWVHYWLVYAVIVTFESILDELVYFVPFYTLLKAALFVYAFLPQTKGASVIYASIIEPAYIQLELLFEEEPKQA